MENYNQNELLSLIQESGIDLFGIADIKEARKDFYLPDQLKALFPLAIVLAKKVIDAVIEEVENCPTLLYFHHYRQLNNELDRVALKIASFIEHKGYRSLPIPASQIIDWKNQRGHLSHKKVGYLAGIGWLGRNNLLVNPVLGARFRLVTILTDWPLPPGSPLSGDCGSCRRCIAVCPAKAIHERQEDFDHMACFRQLDEFRRRGVVSQHICGICVKACAGSLKTRS